ncbi:RNA polymerase sigma-70 factor [Dyadobacter luteus]|jgi:RNA polymerase sigma-70 factor (family 1)|uniref:RNA polymerase sigma-70 factor n=1 Tax=Dyadobacter luteus TaxID=2259619 RepID=A0A3D8Y773_9BACT|nr:RNA polymerase sigma-70 factor [Dyadobacter luteus]REA58228.1 RNA polymerase sigma-70 factor [Dyadobacter luteus]
MNGILTNEAELLQLLRQGDKAAFEEIYGQFQSRLYRTALSKVRTGENAMEIVQEIFLDLWLRRELVQIEDLERYLYTAVKYKVLDFYKKEVQRKLYAESVKLNNQDESSETDDMLAYNELSRSISSCIEKLPEKTRVIFELNRIQCQTADEISRMLDLPLRTVEYHITQGLKSLRANLKDYLILLLLSIGSLF